MKKTIKIVVIVIICLLATVGIVLLLAVSQKENKYQKFLSLGDKYLEELNYEDAVVAYSEAINIMPKRENAYIQLSNVYIRNYDYDNARKVLEDYFVKVSYEERSEAIQEQQELIEVKEKEYVDQNHDSLPDQEEDIDEDVIAIAKRVLGLEYVGGSQFERSFEKREVTHASGIIISPVESSNIISAIKKDFDGDEQEEILVVVRNYHPKSADVCEYNTLSFYMLERNEESWICQDQITVDGYDSSQVNYNLHTVPKKFDFYLKEIDGYWNIYFERHHFGHYFSDGYGWMLFGCIYINNKFERKYETMGIEGSSIDEYLDMDPEMTYDADHRNSVLEFIEKVKDTGINIDKISMDYPTMEVDPDVIKLCRIEYTAQFLNEELYEWQNDSTAQSISGITEKNIDYINTGTEENPDSKVSISDYLGSYETIVVGEGEVGLGIYEYDFGTQLEVGYWYDPTKASNEDFGITYLDGVSQYIAVGQRGNQATYQFDFEFNTDNTINVDIIRISDPNNVIPEGSYHFIKDEGVY